MNDFIDDALVITTRTYDWL